MTKRFTHALIAAFGLALLAAPVAAAQDATPPQSEPAAEETEQQAFAYTVIEEDARIPFGPRRVNSYRVGRDGSLLLRTGVNDWYRATLFAPCARDLPWENQIAIGDRSHTSIDRFSFAIVDGQRCQFHTFDKIEDPRIAERAADGEG
jgi:Family of unknown function (DUF6491)